MRNVALILRREYLERVRTKSFLISTFLFPALATVLIVVPGRMVLFQSSGVRHIVVVASTQQLGEAVKAELETASAQTANSAESLPSDPAENAVSPAASYHVRVDLSPTEDERARLTAKVAAGAIDGYLWLPAEIVSARQARYYARETSDYLEQDDIQQSLSRALLRDQLTSQGMTSEQANALLAPVRLQTITLRQGKESSVSGLREFITVIILILLLYFTVLIHGVAVMRSVVEEKSSRVMEVMLSTATPKQMMGGKLLGVGAVGLTQIGIWMAIAVLLTMPGLLAIGGPAALSFPGVLIPAFAVFFVLGYLLYSALFAALGAMVNSDHEASQYQLIVTLPLVVPMVLLNYVMRQPSAPLSVWMSMVPLFSPVLMYLRMVVQMPPAWQIALSLSILLATIYAVLVLCSRIYRVGILMYGKRPNFSELLKWIRYA